MANTPNFSLYKPNRADNVEVDTSLADNFTKIDTELQNNKGGLAAHISDPDAHTSENISHADGSVKTILDNHEERLGTVDTLEARVDEIETLGLDVLAPNLEGRISTIESDVEGILAPATFEAMNQQSYTFDEYRIGYVGMNASSKKVDNITVKIPTDYPNLQAAIDDLSTHKMKQGKTITLLMETGFRPKNGIDVANGDYKHFIIASQDAEVLVADDYADNFIKSDNANAPTLSCLVNANFKGLGGVWLDNQSSGYVSPGAGVKNCYDRALYVNKNSTVWAESSIFTGGRIQALWVSRVSTAFVDYAKFGGGGAESLDEPVSVHISRQSRVYALGLDVTNSLGTAVKVQRGSVLSAPDSFFSGAKDNGVQVTGGSTAYLENAKIENTGITGLIAQGASNVHAILASIKGKVGNTTGDGVVCENASIIDIDQAVINGFGRYGIIANRAGTINASSTTVTATGNHRVHAEQGSTVNLRLATLNGTGNKDINILRGSFVSAFDCSTTTSPGTPLLAETNVTAFNTLSGQGAIFK